MSDTSTTTLTRIETRIETRIGTRTEAWGDRRMAPPETIESPDAGLAAERLGVLFDAHQARLYRLARRMLSDGEEARDLVQEAFFRAARRPAAVPAGEEDAAAWLTRVLVNLCRDRHRRLAVRRREAPRLEHGFARWATREPAQEPAEEPVAERRLAARSAVQAALARLTPRRRAVVVLHELEERSVAEIARLLGLARPTVRWHLAVARRDLAATLTTGDRS